MYRIGFLKGRPRGAAAVEFALVAPLLTLLLAGVYDAGVAYRIEHVLTKVAREGARLASITPALQPDDPLVDQVVRKVMQQSGVDPTAAECSVSFESPLASGSPIRVNVALGFRPALGALLPSWREPVRLSASTVMRYQAPGEVEP